MEFLDIRLTEFICSFCLINFTLINKPETLREFFQRHWTVSYIRSFMTFFSVEVIGHVLLFRGALDFMYVNMVRTCPPPSTPLLPPFKGREEVNFDYFPWVEEEGIWKIKKLGGSTFPISFFQGLPFLHLEITLPFAKLRHAFEEKLSFSATIILWKRPF